MTDYYSVLGISRQSEADDIAKAYRRAVLAYNPECHRDHEDPQSLARNFKLITDAYVVLSDPKIRSIYDQYGEDGVRHGGTGQQGVPGGVDIDLIDPDAVFRRFFGVDNPFQVIGDISGVQNNQHNFFSTTAVIDKNPPKTDVVEVTLRISLEDIFYGSTRRVSWTITHVNKLEEVTSKESSFEIQIPKGIRAQDFMTLLGKGNTAEGKSQGDVIVTFELEPHPRFRREGDDLVVVAPITLTEALCGATITVKTIEDREIPVLIDEIVHPKFRRRIPGEGLPMYCNTQKRGDLFVECSTAFPSYLTPEQKTELRRILEAEK